MQQGERRYRVRGLAKNLSYELLKVNVLVSGKTPRGESAFHVDTLDLYVRGSAASLRSKPPRSWASRKK